ncbi:MAG: GDP-mannose 4,6-dehydratase [Rhodospirillaceae bacterium]|nr:GDP-mannose 4,6-dehydratase [Rhodospirillaceae bacterium]
MGEVFVIGAGFGGRYFADAIQARCFSRSNGYDLNHNLDGFLAEVARARPSVVANFASQSMVGESWSYPADWMQTNVVAQTRLVQGLARFDFIDRYVHFTTPEVYGSTDGWIAEHWNFRPSTPYAASRAAGDWITKLWHDQYGFPAIFTRAANIYGERQQLYRIIPKSILFALTGRKVPLHGGGLSSRAFIHMDDVTSAIMLLVRHGQLGASYHISPDQCILIRDLVAMIERMLGVSGVSEVVDDRIGKDQAYLLDSAAIRALGWRPQIVLPEGLERVAAWIKSNLDKLSQHSIDYRHVP